MSIAFELVLDIDLHQDRALILGARKNDGGRMAHDGAMAWIGSLSDELTTLQTVLISRDGEGARSMVDCGLLTVGAVRFLNDVLAFPTGPALIVRERVGASTRWSLATLHADGTFSVQALEVTSKSGAHRLKGDVLGQKMTLLMTDEFSSPEQAPDPPRLFVADLGS